MNTKSYSTITSFVIEHLVYLCYLMFLGSELFTFVVSDQDGDALTVTLTHEKNFELEESSPNNYRVLLKDRLDRETNSRYNLQITISDGNGGGVSVSLHFTALVSIYSNPYEWRFCYY